MTGWKPVALVAWALMVLPGLSGCEWRRIAVNDPITPEQVAFIQPGVTTLSDVVAHLGAPDEIEGTEERAVFRYRFLVAKIFRIDFGKLLRPWTPVTPDLMIGRANMATDVFQVGFDSRWIAQDHAFAKQAHTARFNPWPF